MLSFFVPFIAALIALNLHLPKDKQVDFGPITKVQNLDRNEALLKLNQSCRGLLHEVMGLEVNNIGSTLAPLVSGMSSKADNPLAKAFLGKYEIKDIFESVSILCSYPLDFDSEEVKNIPVKEGLVHFSKLLEALPQSIKLKTREQNQVSPIFDSNNELLGYANFNNGEKRIKASSNEIPKGLKLAFLSAEDKTFYENSGVDLAGIMKAFINSSSGTQLYGGSTITQQLIKNTLLNYEKTFDRKINEFLLAYAVTKRFSKEQILEMYLNEIDFGRGAFGVKTAAKVYLGKNLDELNLPDMAFLASLPKSPYNYDPVKNYDLVFKRRNKIIDALYENSYISKESAENAKSKSIDYTENSNVSLASNSSYYVDTLELEAKNILGDKFVKENLYNIHSTLKPDLQESLSSALQDELVSYEKNREGKYRAASRESFILSNISNPISEFELIRQKEIKKAQEIKARLEENAKSYSRFHRMSGKQQANEATVKKDKIPAWNIILKKQRNPARDTNWILAVFLGNKKFGLKNGELINLTSESNGFNANQKLIYGDVILVQKKNKSRTNDVQYFARKIPEVQGAAVVLDNYSGAVLALTGGFSYQQSAWNRALHAKRQPGSLLKPFSYLAALQAGYQPNYMIWDANHRFEKIHKGGHSWAPRDLSKVSNEWYSLRQGLVKSNNRLTSFLLYLIGPSPKDSLNQIRNITREFGLYSKPSDRSLSFILGHQETNVIRAATAYARIANGGYKVSPYLVKEIQGSDGFNYNRDNYSSPSLVSSVDSLSLMQLRNMLSGVTSEGTAKVLKEHSHYLIGKTGTSDRNQDAWFAGSTPQVSIAVWVGYSNQDQSNKKYLVATGGGVAAPVVKNFIESDNYKRFHNNLSSFPSTEEAFDLAYFNHQESRFSTESDPDSTVEVFRRGTDWLYNYRDAQLQYDSRYDYADLEYFLERDKKSLGIQKSQRKNTVTEVADKPIQVESKYSVPSNEDFSVAEIAVASKTTSSEPMQKPKRPENLVIGSPEFLEYIQKLKIFKQQRNTND